MATFFFHRCNLGTVSPRTAGNVRRRRPGGRTLRSPVVKGRLTATKRWCGDCCLPRGTAGDEKERATSVLSLAPLSPRVAVASQGDGESQGG
jgi:hypothetical protein